MLVRLARIVHVQYEDYAETELEDERVYEGVTQVYLHGKKGITLRFADPAVPTALLNLEGYITDSVCFPGHAIVEVLP